MIEVAKAVDALTVDDLQTFAIWQYASSKDMDETFVRPVVRTPVIGLSGKLVGTKVTLANGDLCWALLGNVDPKSSRITEHFLTLSVERNGRWFTLARYHDFDAVEHGPVALARFLGLTVDDVFPIAYDIRQLVRGEDAALHGLIRKEPDERLSRSEIIAMAVP